MWTKLANLRPPTHPLLSTWLLNGPLNFLYWFLFSKRTFRKPQGIAVTYQKVERTSNGPISARVTSTKKQKYNHKKTVKKSKQNTNVHVLCNISCLQMFSLILPGPFFCTEHNYNYNYIQGVPA